MNNKQSYLDAMGIDVWRRRGISFAQTENLEGIQSNTPSSRGEAVATSPTSTETTTWESLRQQVSACTQCGLCSTRTQTVFGVGNNHADLLIIGEAPGANEDKQGEPFVGRAGQLLNGMLKSIGFERDQVFIANILKCRPPNNRDPKPEEVATCTPFIEKQIALLQPKAIMAVGRIAGQFLLSTNTPLGKMRNQVHRYGKDELPLVITYHPAYLLRSPKDKRKAYQDLVLAKKQLI